MRKRRKGNRSPPKLRSSWRKRCRDVNQDRVLVTLNYLDKGGRALAFACGVAIGLTVASKYNGVLVLLPFILAILLRRGLRSLATSDLYLGAAGSVVDSSSAVPTSSPSYLVF